MAFRREDAVQRLVNDLTSNILGEATKLREEATRQRFVRLPKEKGLAVKLTL